MEKISFRQEAHIAIVTMDRGENRFNFSFFEEFNRVLDAVETQSDASVMVVTSADRKVWSNGIDLDWLMTEIDKTGPDIGKQFMVEMYQFLKRILNFSMLTIASISGHAFGGGAFLSFAHDVRFMRSDRGWMCMPEVDINMTLGPVFMVLAKRAMPNDIFEEMQFTGVRMTADDCVHHHIVRKSCHIDDLMNETLSFAKGLNKNRDVIAEMKKETHQEINLTIDNAIAAFQ